MRRRTAGRHPWGAVRSPVGRPDVRRKRRSDATRTPTRLCPAPRVHVREWNDGIDVAWLRAGPLVWYVFCIVQT
eukprot:6443467-Prymnesium_polylepis.2